MRRSNQWHWKMTTKAKEYKHRNSIGDLLASRRKSVPPHYQIRHYFWAVGAFIWSHCCRTIYLAKLPIRSLSTNIKIGQATNWLQVEKQAATLLDRTLLTCWSVCVEALLQKRGALTNDLQKWLLRSMSTQTKIVSSANSFQAEKKRHGRHRDRTLRLTCIGLFVWRRCCRNWALYMLTLKNDR